MPSRVSFMRRLSSILSSRVPRMGDGALLGEGGLDAQCARRTPRARGILVPSDPRVASSMKSWEAIQ